MTLKMAAVTRSFLVAILGVIVTLVVTRTDAMDFSFRPFAFPTPEGPKAITVLLASGEIRSGDAKRLRQFIAVNYSPERSGDTVVLDSPGGDVDEAIRIAQVLRELLSNVSVFSPATCASACFFLYVGAAKHDALPGLIAIHRPYFAADTTRQMSAAQAELAHRAGFAKAKRWLQEQLVPQVLIDRLFALSSRDAYRLNAEDIASLGDRAPWYEEWLLAHCPHYVEVKRRVFATAIGTSTNDDAWRAATIQIQCEADAGTPQQILAIKRYMREFGRNPNLVFQH